MSLYWASKETSEEWNEKSWNISPCIPVQGLYEITFQYTHGLHRLDIKNLSITADNEVISYDTHLGITGCSNNKNTYHVSIDCPLNKEITMKALVRSDGGNDSNGIIKLNLLESHLPTKHDTFKTLQSEANQIILKDINNIEIGGCLAGLIICASDKAFPIISDNDNHSIACGCAAGNGRIVAFGHNCFLNKETLEIGDNKKLITNSIEWVSGNKQEKRIGVLNCNCAEIVNGKNINESEDFSNYDVILVHNHNIPNKRLDDMRKFIINGGGLLITCIGWGWLQCNPGKSIKNDDIFNKLVSEFGLINCESYSNKPYQTTNLNCHLFNSFSCLEKIENGNQNQNQNENIDNHEYQIDTEILSQYLICVPDKFNFFEHPLMSKIGSDFQISLGRGQITAKSKLASALISFRMRRGEYLPAMKQAASIYPGIPEITNFVTKNIEIPREKTEVTDQWHSTGLFAVAGEPFTIQITGDNIKNINCNDIVIRIGTTTCNITNHKEWHRAPSVSYESELNSPCSAFMSPYGGLIYIIFKKPLKDVKYFSASFSHVIEAICYSKESKSIMSFDEEKKTKFAPMCEMVGKNVIFTITRDFALTIKDPDAFVDGWDKVCELEDELACTTRKRPERICCDIQVCAGYMHSGYPIMVPISALVDIDKVISDGQWGYFHELGHNHQSGDWTYESAGEVTVNIFSLFVSQEFSHLDIRKVWCMGELDDKIKKFASGGKSFGKLTQDLALHLGIYQRIALEFGFDVIKRFFISFYESDSIKPTNDQEKYDQWAIRLTKITSVNVGYVFKTWTFPISDEALHFCSQFPDAPKSLTKWLDD